MTRGFLLIMFLLSSLCLVAQGGYPFPIDQAEWHVTKVTPILGPDDAFDRWEYWVNGDTFLIDSTLYSFVYARGTCHSDPSTSFQYQPYTPAQYARIGGLRQEGDSIFFRRISFPSFKGSPSTIYSYPLDEEVLLYDFSLEKGDTFEYITPDRKFVVENVSVNAQGRKEIQLSSFGCGYPIYVTWREGQGCTNGLLETICIYFYAGSCFYSEATGEPACVLPCTPDDPVLVSTTPSFLPEAVKLYPNPTSGNLTLSLESFQEPVHLEVVDMMGRVAYQQMIVNPMTELTLSHLANGIYQVNLIGSSGRRWNSRLMVSR